MIMIGIGGTADTSELCEVYPFHDSLIEQLKNTPIKGNSIVINKTAYLTRHFYLGIPRRKAYGLGNGKLSWRTKLNRSEEESIGLRER
jgi:hypothetical protein